MFGFLKNKQVCNNMELYRQVQADGVEYAGAKIANILVDKWLLNRNLAYLFILQELDGAIKGNQVARNFAQNSGVAYSEYNGALQRDMPDDVEEATFFLVQLSMGLQPLKDLIVQLRLEVLTGVMKLYKIGIYENDILYQDGLLDNIEPCPLLGYVNIEQPWSFNSLKCDLDLLSDKLPKDYNALMPTLYAMRFAYAGLYNQGRITWGDFDEIDNDHFMAIMIKIGNRISRSEQVYFQEKSNEKALELLKEYEPLINSRVMNCFIRSAKNKFSLQGVIGDDLIVTSHMAICYFSKFGYDENQNEEIVRKNFIDMLIQL